MLIDWFTVIAQIVNFVILVALMKHFLYGPLIKAMDDREKRIATQLEEAARQKKEAGSEMQEAQQQLADLQTRGVQIIADAREEADRKKNEMMETARNSVRGLEQKWKDDLRLEQTTFFNEVRHAAAAEILEITRRVLADLASADVERSAVEAFLEKLRSFDSATLKKLSSKGLTVVSGKELPQDLRRQIEDTIQKIVESPVSLCFEQVREMPWGIALQGDGQRIGWTPDTYLDSLEQKLKTTLNERVELVL